MHHRVLLSRVNARGEHAMQRASMWKRVVAIVVATVMIGSIVITQENAGIRRQGLNDVQMRASPAHIPIYIASNAAMNASADAPGDGTVGSPCIIQNYQINGGDSGSCIEIRNVDLYVTIQNCTLYNSGSLISNGDSGIELFNCQNIKIINCTIYDSLAGIWLIYSSDITIENNYIHNSMYHGIWLENTESSTVKTNRIQSNSRHGIMLESSGSNTISFNNCTSNGLRGIYFDTLTYENTVYLNYFGLNVVSQAWDDGVGNIWDSPIGNRYSDYSTRYPLATNDGILWDTPYTLNGIAYAVDTKPVYDVSGTHGTIRILNNTAMDAFCIGNGTNGLSWATAHRIRNYKISAGGGDYCIQLQNINRYVIIEDCTFITAYQDAWGSAGIKLQNCSNIQVNNCSISYNTVGVLFENSIKDCIINGNAITSNSYDGMRILQSYNLTIHNNTVNNNRYNGIHVYMSCKDNNFSLNHIENNGINGLILQNEQNTTVDGNWFVNNYIGSQIVDSGNLTIKNNHVVNSTYYGFGIFNSPGDLIFDSNQIISSAYAGIYIWASIGVFMVSNNMTNASVVMEGNLSQLSSYSINTSNKVNNKPLYYYHDQNGLDAADFTNAGEAIIINCNSSLISGINCSSGSNGIVVYYCTNTTVSSSTLTEFTSVGFFIKSSTNCTITGNSLINCTEGISISTCTDITMVSNAFVDCGLAIDSTIDQCETFQIGTSNTVNGRLMRFYVSQSGLVESDFSTAGQIILINCNNSRVSNQNVSHGTYGIFCLFSYNNSFTSIVAHTNYLDGARIQNSSEITITGGTFSGCGRAGIYVLCSTNCTIEGTVIDGCYWGLFLGDSANSSAVNNTISNCGEVGLYFSEASWNNVENNTIYGNNFHGVYITVSKFNEFLANNIFNNNVSGITCYDCRWSKFIQNNVHDNGYGIYLAQNTSHNVFYFNSFAGNPESNAYYKLYFYGTNNTWSNGTEGNYWGDYSSRYPGATNLGRTWSNAYALNGSTSDVDPHPLVYPWEPNTHPAVMFMVALSTTVLTNNDVQFVFTGTSGNLPAGYQWRFGDGTANSTMQHPIHRFTYQGNFTVTLMVTDADGQTSVLNRVGFISAYTEGGDYDGDGLTNDQEIAFGTSITKPDTDGDGIPDGYEVSNGLNVIVQDGTSDADQDGLDNYHEYLAGTRADNPDSDRDGFTDKIEIDWHTDPTNSVSSPLTIILFPILFVTAVIVVVLLALRVAKMKKKAKTKVPSYSRGDWTDDELIQDSQHIEEKIDEKRAILSRVMEPTTTDEQKAAISPEMPGKFSATGKKKASTTEEIVTHQVDEQTESEVEVFKKKESCIVCNTILKATTYICPHCETKYCIRCAIALSDQKENCWVCKNPMNFNP